MRSSRFDRQHQLAITVSQQRQAPRTRSLLGGVVGCCLLCSCDGSLVHRGALRRTDGGPPGRYDGQLERPTKIVPDARWSTRDNDAWPAASSDWAVSADAATPSPTPRDARMSLSDVAMADASVDLTQPANRDLGEPRIDGGADVTIDAAEPHASVDAGDLAGTDTGVVPAADIAGSPGTCSDYDHQAGSSTGGPFGMVFVRIPPGSFRMGEGALRGGVLKRDVTIAHAFYIGSTEVTNRQYEYFDPDHYRHASTASDNQPVSFIKWRQARAFAAWLTDCDRDSGRIYRLPREEEWEWAARSGEAADIDVPTRCEANFYGAGSDKTCVSCVGRCDTYADKTAPVASFAANLFGLHDALGNVSEWVSTDKDTETSNHIHKGRSWHSGTGLGMTPPDRQTYGAGQHGKKVGLRLVVELPK